MASPGANLGATVGLNPANLASIRPGDSLGWGPEVPTLLYSDPRDGGNGQYCSNADKALVKWRWVPAKFQNRLFPVTFSSGETTDLDVQIGGGSGTRGDTEIGSFLLTTSAGRVAVRPYVSSPIDKYLSNIPIPSNLMFGTAQLPGMLQSSVYSLANTFWRMTTQNLFAGNNTVSMVLFGRKFTDRGREQWANERRRAELLSVAWPYWIGPQDISNNATLTGPEVTLTAGSTVTLRFPVPSGQDFLLRHILDDSTSTTGVEPLLTATIVEEDTNRTLIDFPSGIRWRDFLACPTVSVTGFPSGGTIRAFSLGSPKGGWTHLVKRNSALVITFTSSDPGTITLRPALAGWLLAAQEPGDRHYSNDAAARVERIEQAAAAGANPVRLFGTGGGR